VNAATVSSGEANYVALASSMRDFWCHIPTGTNIYIRCSISAASADSNYDFLVTGFG
jgi:hypothetical protein